MPAWVVVTGREPGWVLGAGEVQEPVLKGEQVAAEQNGVGVFMLVRSGLKAAQGSPAP